MRPFYIILLIVFGSCGPKMTSINYGKTTVAALIEQKGDPQSEEGIPIRGGKIHIYGDEKYQSEGGIVTAGFRTPKGDERALLYWRHRFKNCSTEEKTLSGDERELVCTEEGMSVVYSQGSEFVSRIVEYAR